MRVHSIIDWLTLEDYHSAIREARIAVIKRLARGNVTFQNGSVMDDEALDQLRSEGDRAIAGMMAQRDSSSAHAAEAH